MAKRRLDSGMADAAVEGDDDVVMIVDDEEEEGSGGRQRRQGEEEQEQEQEQERRSMDFVPSEQRQQRFIKKAGDFGLSGAPVVNRWFGLTRLTHTHTHCDSRVKCVYTHTHTHSSPRPALRRMSKRGAAATPGPTTPCGGGLTSSTRRRPRGARRGRGPVVVVLGVRAPAGSRLSTRRWSSRCWR
jgi:hypothetical protein